MASRRFFAYDPYDYYYPAPYHYPYPYYYHHSAPAPAPATAPSRSDVNTFFPAGGYDAEPAVRAAAHQPRPRTRLVSVPVQFVRSKPEPEPEPERQELRVPPVAGKMAEAAVPAKKRAPSAEDAAVRMQAAARGFLARWMVREVRAVEREAEGVAVRVAAEAEALRGNARARVAVGEELMRLLLRLDAVHGAREYRRRVTKKVLALQDAVDALEPRAAPKPAAVEMAVAHAAEEGQMAPDLLDGEDHGIDMDAKTAVEAPATEMATEMEVDGVRATGERDAEDAENSMDDGEKPEAAEGEWEMVTEESAAACITEAAEAGERLAAPEERQEEPTGEEEEKKAEGGAADGLDARRVMEMVAALCERSAQQCAVIGALAEQVDALERAVRRVEGADRRRRRNKLKKEGKGNTKCTARSCYSDQ